MHHSLRLRTRPSYTRGSFAYTRYGESRTPSSMPLLAVNQPSLIPVLHALQPSVDTSLSQGHAARVAGSRATHRAKC